MAYNKSDSVFQNKLIGASSLLLLVAGIGLFLGNMKATQTFTQNANLTYYSDVAVQGAIYNDTNRNGVKDSNEQNYTGNPQAKVQLALFTNSCPPPPQPRPSLSPIPPVPPPGCRYVTGMCPMIACRAGQTCPPCKKILVCITPDGGAIPPQGSGVTTNSTQGNSINVQSETVSQDMLDAQNNDVCRRLPVQVINCPVGADGNYACISQHSLFTTATVRVVPPFNYYVTSKNPVILQGNTGIVNFGLFPKIY